MEKFRRGALYIRVSTDDQTEYSPDSQIKICKRFAQDHDIEILPEHIYQEDGISGRQVGKRKRFQTMIYNAKQEPKPFEVIIVYSFSRFARNREDSIIYKSMLRKKLGIEVLSATQPLSDGKESVIMEALYEAMDEYYSLDLAENSLRGKIEKASRGEHLGGIPYGYTMNKNKKLLEPDKDKKCVQFIFEEWIKPEATLSSIVSTVNKLGLKTKRGGQWCPETIKQFLNNPVYIGYTRFCLGGFKRNYNHPDLQVTKGKHKPIISQELWDKAQEKMKVHDELWFPHKRHYVKQEYWVRGILKCPHCGMNYKRVKRSDPTHSNPYYVCNGRTRKVCDKGSTIREYILEELILEELKRTFTERVDIDISYEVSSNDPTQLILDTVSKYKSRLKRYEDAYADGIDSLEEYKGKKKSTLEEISRLEKELSETNIKKRNDKERDKVYKLCEHAHAVLSDPDVEFAIKEKLANSLFDKITYDGQKKILYITYKGTP